MAKIAFIQEELRERFGIMILSAVLKKSGHECDIFVEEVNENFSEEVLKYEPDIIAFSTMTAGTKFAFNNAKKLKELSNAFILMGGPHPTFYPEVLNEGFLDAICIGEGDEALTELADRLDKGEDLTDIQNIWVKKDGKIYKNELRPLADVSKLPLYDRELYYKKFTSLRDAPTKKVFMIWGCPYDCTYCFNHSLKRMYKGKGPFVRYADVENIINEMKYIKENYKVTWFQFSGDTLNVKKNWFLSFLERYKKEINMPFLCNVRIEKVDEELVRKMKEAGCDRVDFGVEHGDEDIRRNVLKRHMTDAQIIKGGRLFNKYGIRICTANIVGVPHETVETAFKTINLNRKFKAELARAFSLQPYPKTEIFDYAIAHGFLDSNSTFSIEGTGFQIGFDGSADSMSLKLDQHNELMNLYYFFSLLVKHKWLEPLCRLLIKLPPNRIFFLIHAFPIIKNDFIYSKSLKKRVQSILAIFNILFKKN